MTARLYLLSELHQKIDDRLRFEQRKRLPDRFELSRLKTIKLRIKHRISALLVKATQA